jgi:hypothetical protein
LTSGIQERSPMAETPRSRSAKWWIGGGLAVVVVLLAISAWSWTRAAWVYPDLSEQQRTEQFNDALVARRNGAGVIARLERGGLTILARSDVAQIGASQCVREMACESYLRLPLRNDPGLACLHVGVTFSCAYAIKTTDGRTATAFAKFHSNRQHEMCRGSTSRTNFCRGSIASSAFRGRAPIAC